MAIPSYNVYFECLLQALLQHLHHSFTLLSLCLALLTCYNFAFKYKISMVPSYIQPLLLKIEVLGSKEVCGSVTALRMTKIVICCSTVLELLLSLRILIIL